MLPNDKVETKRLNSQHEAIITMMGDLFPNGSGVDEILSSSGDGPRRVLDLGTGTGTWAIDVAEKYPSAEVLGVDISPVDPAIPRPTNCRFEIADAESGFERYGRFDVIHARAVLQGVNDYQGLFESVAKVLSPGGVFISIEPDTIFSKNKVAYGPQKEGEPGFSWMHEVVGAFHKAQTKRNPSHINHSKVDEVLRTTPGQPWATIARADMLVPTAAFDLEDPTERAVGALMHSSHLQLPRAFERLLLTSELFEADYVHKMVESSWVVVYAKKKLE
ncbi:hypothetical protein FRB90_009616 [Tulasnella sp. 427]|nr:hypothetical protein FRB90_009616 [Tulasnella sp. 427]